VSTSGQKVARPAPRSAPDDCSVPENQPAGRAACYLLGRGQGLRSQRRCDLQPAVAYQLVTTRPLDRESLRGGAVAATVSCADAGSSPRRTVRGGCALPCWTRTTTRRTSRGRYSRCSWTRSSNRDHYWPGQGGGRGRMAGSELLAAGRSDPDAEVVSVDSDSGAGQVAGSIRPRDARPLSVSTVTNVNSAGDASDGVHAATALVGAHHCGRERPRAGVGRRRFESAASVRENSPANTPGLRGQWPGGLPPGAARLGGGSSASGPTAEVYVVAGGGLELDRERTPTLSLKVIAFDFGRPTRRQNVSQTRTTARRDCCSPASPTTGSAVSCRLPVGGWVARLRAADSDESDNARLSFGHRRRPVALSTSPWTLASGNLTPGQAAHLRDVAGTNFALRVSAKDHGRPPRFTAGALFIDPEEPPTQLVPPQPRGSRRRPEADRAGGPAAAPTAAATEAAWMAAWAAAGALGAGPGPGGGALPHCRHAAAGRHPRPSRSAFCGSERRGADKFAEGISVKRGQNSLSAKDISLPQTPSDSVAAAAAAAEQSLLM
uniref:SHR-BD domain-containing protein n=1 Tax=Macrostomum lignano TaxID=282301 RepID=A0A1I8F2H7_9PLAT